MHCCSYCKSWDSVSGTCSCVYFVVWEMSVWLSVGVQGCQVFPVTCYSMQIKCLLPVILNMTMIFFYINTFPTGKRYFAMGNGPFSLSNFAWTCLLLSENFFASSSDLLCLAHQSWRFKWKGKGEIIHLL